MSAPVLQFRPDADGSADGDVLVELERLVPSRALVQGDSGAGKSRLVRYMLEQTHGRIQHLVIDPEGEFVTLRERFDYVVASAGGDGDVRASPATAALLCRQLMELQASAILDIYELSPPDRQKFVAAFLGELMNLPRAQWRPVLVVVDEAHEYAPQGGEEPPSQEPMELLVSKGRKRGYCAVFLTQRLSALSKNASALQNVLIGFTGLDVDVARAGAILGFDRRRRQELKTLEPGEFFAFGPAISREVVKVRGGEVVTYHPKPGEIAPPTPPASGELARLIAQMAAIPSAAPEGDEEGGPGTSATSRTGPTEAEIAERVRAAREEGWAAGADAARAAARQELGPAAATLYHALANGNGGTAGLTAAEPGPTPPAAAVETARAPGYQAPPPAARPPRPRAVAPEGGSEGLTGPQRRILFSLAWWESIGIATPLDAGVAFVAQYAPSNSSYQRALGQLRTGGMVDYPAPGARSRTPAGRAASPEVDGPRSKATLHATVLQQLTGPQRRILEPLLRAYPKEMPLDELAAASGYEESNSSFQRARGQLKTLELVTYPGQRRNRAADFLFPKGLR